MPMPHFTQMYVIEKRLKEKFGKSRIKELRQILLELPGYNTGPYGEIKKWVVNEIQKSKTNSKNLYREEFAVKKEGACQVVFVAPPNVGKSSLLNALSDKQVKIADYAFTTIKPEVSSINYSGISIQIIEIPGLIEGASENKGFGKRLINVARTADAIVFVHNLTAEPKELQNVIDELKKESVEKPHIIIANKSDIATDQQKEIARQSFGEILLVSAVTKQGLEKLREEIWKLTGFIRAYTKDNEKPVALKKGSTVKDLAEKIHKEFAKKVKAAKITGSSAKFQKQIVGLSHVLEDNDRVWLIEK